MWMVVVLILMSAKDRLERKKYIGMWRWGSELMTRMMSTFPNKVTRYNDRKPKEKGLQVWII